VLLPKRKAHANDPTGVLFINQEKKGGKRGGSLKKENLSKKGNLKERKCLTTDLPPLKKRSREGATQNLKLCLQHAEKKAALRARKTRSASQKKTDGWTIEHAPQGAPAVQQTPTRRGEKRKKRTDFARTTGGFLIIKKSL